MKKILAIILSVAMMLTGGVSAFAAAPETVAPLWENDMDIDNTLSFTGTNGTTGMAASTIYGVSGTTYISATLTVHVLQGTRWVYVGSDSGSVESTILGLYVGFTGVSGSYYRSMLEFTVIKDGVSESDTIFKYAWC